MEIHAYNELYIESAQNIMGHMFDFAINEVGIAPEIYVGLFLNCPVSKQIEIGNPAFVAGKTGPEIARLVLEQTGYMNLIKDMPADVMYVDRSPEYWVGWAIAYYQWKRNYSFRYIFQAISFDDCLKMHPIYHEMDIEKFVENADKMITIFYTVTALRRYREMRGLSQKELSIKADVPIRQIQLFEQRQRDITKAQAITVYKLSKALGCDVRELILE